MPLDRTLRRNAWLLPAPLLALAAALSAQAIGALVEVALSLDADELARPPPRSSAEAPSAEPTHATSAHAILLRNPFDHATGSLISEADAPDAPGASSVDIGDPWSAPTCEGIEVHAIMASDDVDWSFAAVAGADNKARLLRRGASFSGRTMHFIGWDRVWLSSTDGLCQARLFDPKKAPPPPTPAAPPPIASSAAPRRSGPKPVDPDIRKGIQAVSATEFNVDRSVLDRILENQAELMRQARVIPVQEGGRVVGIRLLGLRPDTLLGVLGMQNGDQLQTINGFDLGSPEKALEAYARLRTADKLTIQMNRGGKKLTLDYNIK